MSLVRPDTDTIADILGSVSHIPIAMDSTQVVGRGPASAEFLGAVLVPAKQLTAAMAAITVRSGLLDLGDEFLTGARTALTSNITHIVNAPDEVDNKYELPITGTRAVTYTFDMFVFPVPDPFFRHVRSTNREDTPTVDDIAGPVFRSYVQSLSRDQDR